MNLAQRIVKSVSDVVFPTAQGEFYPLMNSSRAVQSLTRSDYIRLYTGWQYLAVSTIANSVAELSYSLTRNMDSDKSIDHKHLGLVNYKFLQQLVSSLQLTGSAYYRKVMIGAKIDELQYLRTDYVHIEENADGSIKNYRYTSRGGTYNFAPDDIIDFSLYSPLQTRPEVVKGVSPMQAVAMQAELDQTATRWNRNFFKNNASIGGVLKTDKSVTQESKSRAIRKWKEKYQWVNNSNSIAFLDNGVEYQELKVSQKELDFVESRRFTRDEVLAVFKVPKAVVGITDDVNRATAQTSERIYYKVCISPLTVMIQEILNKELFNGIGYFQFLNTNPLDKEELRLDYEAGAITLNEYRRMIGHQPLKDWDVLKLNPMMVDSETQYTVQNQRKEVSEIILKSLNSNTKGTPEYKAKREKFWQKIREAKISRTDRYESQYEQQVRKIFKEQEEKILEQVTSQKWLKIQQPKLDLLSTARWIVGLQGLYKEIFQIEGNEAINQVGITATFDVWKNSVNNWIKDSIALMSKEVNEYTKKILAWVIEQGNDEGLGANQIARKIQDKFDDMSSKRAKAIARTEITRASSEAEIQARKQTGVVSRKERYTALDERVCPECNAMHWKTVALEDTFIDKGETYRGIKYDYADVKGSPLHVNCRCSLLAVID